MIVTSPGRLPFLALVLLFACPALPSAAQWSYHGLAGPFIREMQLHDGFLYVANDEGLYRKRVDEADTTWTLVGLEGREVRAFEVLGADSLLAVVYVYQDGFPHHQELYRTPDGGATWEPVAEHLREEAPEAFFEVVRRHPAPPHPLFAGGSATLSRSDDGGDTWHPVSGDWGGFGMGVHFVAFDPLRPDVVWSGGESAIFWPFLLRSDDGGATWETISLDLGGDNAVYAMAIDAADSDVLYIGTEGHVLRSTDGGETWEALLSPETYEYFSGLAISPADRDRLYAAGLRNAFDQRLTLYVSDDGGATWSTYTHGELSLWLGAEELVVHPGPGADTVFLATRYDGVYAFEAPLSTGSDRGRAPLPTGFQLAQNYPNPFNPTTRIRFTLDAAGHARLTVYDVLGREVARLVDGPLAAGAYEVTWGADGRPGGTYLYRLEAGPSSATRRMTLLK